MKTTDTPATTATVVDDLDALGKQIVSAVDDAERHARGAVASALRAGELLTRAKKQVEHGEWQRWVADHCPGLALRTAQAHMRLYERFSALPKLEAQRVALLPLREAMTAIATLPDAPPRMKQPRLPPTEALRAKSVLDSAASALSRLSRDLHRSIKRDRLKGLRDKLQTAISEVDAMLERSQ